MTDAPAPRISHADIARAAMVTRATKDALPIKLAIGAYAEKLRAVYAADDLVEAMRAVAGLVLACEGVASTIGNVIKTTRDALAETLAETGAMSVQTSSHTVSLREGSMSVIVTDPALLPPEVWRTPEPAPDKVLIGKLLRDGQHVPGATLSNQAPSLQFKPRKNPTS